MSKETEIAAFIKRANNPPEQINNASLYAGSSMYFYCKHCGFLSDTLPETYITPPTCCCGKCSSLKRNGWLTEAKTAFKKQNKVNA